MSVSRETSNMRIQRAIEAEARMREVAKKSKNWPDLNAKAGVKHDLKPLYVRNLETESLIQAAKQTTERDVA